jgi:hypothetical protein
MVQEIEEGRMLKVSDFPKNRENPFINKLIEDVTPVQRRRMITPTNKEVTQQVINQDGEQVGLSAFVQYVEVDEKQFAKLYLSQLGAFWDLSKPALRVFTYIMSTIKPNADTIDFDMEECLSHCQYQSKSQVFKGLADLLQKNIIARGKTEYQYFINPIITFNGDRVLFAKGIIKKKIKSTASVDQLSLFGNIDGAGLSRLRTIERTIDKENQANSEVTE